MLIRESLRSIETIYEIERGKGGGQGGFSKERDRLKRIRDTAYPVFVQVPF
jgi:hypothetical protein